MNRDIPYAPQKLMDNPVWKETGKMRWVTVKEACGYRLQRMQKEVVDFRSETIGWTDCFNVLGEYIEQVEEVKVW